ncbi:uncharacterized protein VTP21DRAFT_5867 [Calcarisporiella thermophila]|uniref:uncharacterized protein n=1 Tax=Calcarisporiella thermophila TaxID=911321 RepID=UPI003743BB7B
MLGYQRDLASLDRDASSHPPPRVPPLQRTSICKCRLQSPQLLRPENGRMRQAVSFWLGPRPKQPQLAPPLQFWPGIGEESENPRPEKCERETSTLCVFPAWRQD